MFAREAHRLRQALGDAVPLIEHVGSTSVPLFGQPIVDLLLGVVDLEAGRRLTPALIDLGYEDFGEIFIPGRGFATALVERAAAWAGKRGVAGAGTTMASGRSE